MRRRVVRDIGTLLGVVVVLVAVVLINDYMRRGSLSDQMDVIRKKAENDQKAMGVDLLHWALLRETKGTRRSGPTFDPRLVEFKDSAVDLVGFMVPMYEFRNVKEFLLLPLPIECYFCQAPPMRDVVLVQMAKDTAVDIVKEPVLINGTLTLNEGPGTKFFYVVKDAGRGPAEKGGKLHTKRFSQDHIMHSTGAKQLEEQQKEPLLEGQEPPKAPGNTVPLGEAPGTPSATE